MNVRHLGGHAALVAGLLASTSFNSNFASAQDREAIDDPQFEEIIVSARRRDESAQDVPIAVTALTGEQLNKLGPIDITVLNQVVPNVTVEVSRGTNTTLTPFIRGVGQQDPVAGFEQGVGVYIDDVYLNRPQGAIVDIYDIERLEVLRGPQGTLYGRNTIGGAIKYVTRRLGPEPELRLRVSGGSFNQFDGVLTVSAPISDTLRVGGTIASFNRDGFGENLNIPGLDNGSKKIVAGRASLEWSPSENFFLRVAGDYTSDTSDPRQGSRLIPAAVSGNPVLDSVFDTEAGLINPEAEVVNRGFSVTAEWTVNENLTLKNILAYRDNRSQLPEDFDSLPVDDLDVPVIFEDDQFSEEFQVLYQSDWINGIFGFYYLNARAFNAFDVILGPTGDLLGLPGLNAFTLGDVDTDSWSVFGDVTFDISEEWSLSVGGRFTSDERTALIQRQTFLGGFSPALGGLDRAPIATATDFTGNETFEDFTPRISLAYAPNDNHNFYASFSEGFKGGGFDPRGSATAAPDLNGNGVAGAADLDDVQEFLLFQPEQITTYELGWKASTFDGRLKTSIAAFYSDYEDIQIPGSIGVDTDNDGIAETFVGITSNAGQADIFGVEFEGQAFLAETLWSEGDSLSLNWGLGWIDASFNEFVNALGQDIADDATFQNTPRWTLNAGLNYTAPLKIYGSDGNIAFLPSLSFRSRTNQFEISSPLLDQPAYALLDVSLVWTSDDGRWQVGVHGKNLTNTEYIVAGFDFVNDQTLAPELGLEGTLTAFFGNPRTVTATMQLNF
jgi:iron complex outermembrane receptor protein